MSLCERKLSIAVGEWITSAFVNDEIALYTWEFEEKSETEAVTKKSHYQADCTGQYMSCRFVNYVYLMCEEPESSVRYRKYTPKEVNPKFTFNGMS